MVGADPHYYDYEANPWITNLLQSNLPEIFMLCGLSTNSTQVFSAIVCTQSMKVGGMNPTITCRMTLKLKSWDTKDLYKGKISIG